MEPWIDWISDERATGRLAEIYEGARKRAGKVFNIIRIMGQNPATLEAFIGFYSALMLSPSPLTRVQREMLATAVSHENACHY